MNRARRQPKVAVLGAAGGIGQPLSLLLKMDAAIGELALYDVANTPGVACDLSHLSSPATVKGYLGPEQLPAALQGAQLVVIPAGAWWGCSTGGGGRGSTDHRATRPHSRSARSSRTLMMPWLCRRAAQAGHDA